MTQYIYTGEHVLVGRNSYLLSVCIFNSANFNIGVVTAEEDGDQQLFASLPDCDVRHKKEGGYQDADDVDLDWGDPEM
jgi:hypothetical protein